MSEKPGRITGTLTKWNDERGFGFITPAAGGKSVFVHIAAFPPGGARPAGGEELTFEMGVDPKGKDQAVRVRPAHQSLIERLRITDARAKPGNASYFALPAFLLIYLAVYAAWGLPWWVSVLYGGLTILCFLVYAADKSAAVAGQWRIPENSLLILGLVGGWPGAIVAQQVFRHKTTKSSFRVRFWVTVILNVAAFVAFSSPALRAAVSGLLRAIFGDLHH